MLSFKQHLESDSLTEALITFANQAYPKFGNVVILAGGAASGKGYVKDDLMGIDGLVLDVDALKKLTQSTPKIIEKIKKQFGVDISLDNFDMKVPENVAILHNIIGVALNLDDRKKQAIYSSILTADPSRKPNLIFDVTLKDLQKLQSIAHQVKNLGYDNKKIHIVWVINDIEVAKKQNLERKRVVPVEILINTHRGASLTMHDIVTMGNGLKKYMDGDIVFVFNKVNVDSEVRKSNYGGSYIKTANYFYLKRSGKAVDVNQLTKDVRAKLASYVPPSVSWV